MLEEYPRCERNGIKSIFILIVSIFTIFGQQTVFSQTQNESTPASVLTLEKASCEMNSNFLVNFLQNTARDKFVIVISHLGISERKNFGQRRLNNAEIFFTKHSSETAQNRSSDSFVVAEGKKTDKNGFWIFMQTESWRCGYFSIKTKI